MTNGSTCCEIVASVIKITSSDDAHTSEFEITRIGFWWCVVKEDFSYATCATYKQAARVKEQLESGEILES